MLECLDLKHAGSRRAAPGTGVVGVDKTHHAVCRIQLQENYAVAAAPKNVHLSRETKV